MARIPDRGVPQTLQTGESSATMRHLWVRGSSPGRAPNPAQGVAAGGVKGTPHVPEVGMPDFDVIIVGARVAGSLTAALLGERGWRVLLLDRATFPSDTLSTHFFREPAMLAFRRAGVWDDVQAVGAPLLVNMFNDIDGVTFGERVRGGGRRASTTSFASAGASWTRSWCAGPGGSPPSRCWRGRRCARCSARGRGSPASRSRTAIGGRRPRPGAWSAPMDSDLSARALSN